MISSRWTVTAKVRHHDQAAIAFARERIEHALDVIGIAHVDRIGVTENDGAAAWTGRTN